MLNKDIASSALKREQKTKNACLFIARLLRILDKHILKYYFINDDEYDNKKQINVIFNDDEDDDNEKQMNVTHNDDDDDDN